MKLINNNTIAWAEQNWFAGTHAAKYQNAYHELCWPTCIMDRRVKHLHNSGSNNWTTKLVTEWKDGGPWHFTKTMATCCMMWSKRDFYSNMRRVDKLFLFLPLSTSQNNKKQVQICHIHSFQPWCTFACQWPRRHCCWSQLLTCGWRQPIGVAANWESIGSNSAGQGICPFWMFWMDIAPADLTLLCVCICLHVCISTFWCQMYWEVEVKQTSQLVNSCLCLFLASVCVCMCVSVCEYMYLVHWTRVLKRSQISCL